MESDPRGGRGDPSRVSIGPRPESFAEIRLGTIFHIRNTEYRRIHIAEDRLCDGPPLDIERDGRPLPDAGPTLAPVVAASTIVACGKRSSPVWHASRRRRTSLSSTPAS